MGKQEVAQKWWEALSGRLEEQGGAEFLFVHNKEQGKLERCFDRNIGLKNVDAETVDKLYQAATEGRLGLLRPDDMKPQLLTADPEKMFASGKGAVEEETPAEKMTRLDEEKRERDRKEKARLLAAQNLFIWAAASDKRDREAFEARMEYLEQMDDWQIEPELAWKERLMNIARELQLMTRAGSSEEACNEKIRRYLDGETTPKDENPQEEMQPVSRDSTELWGNALRQFCRFAASEVPLSVRHVQVAEHCRRIMRQVKEIGMSMKDLGLDPQEQMVVLGTMEMGALVKRGLVARKALTSGKRLPGKQYRECLRNYLAMKGMEETLIPHVENFQKEISKGEGPISALQVLMANPGFRADDLREKVGKTSAMASLERIDPQQVSWMIRSGSEETAALGRQVMSAICEMGDVSGKTRVPKAPQKGGPAR